MLEFANQLNDKKRNSPSVGSFLTPSILGLGLAFGEVVTLAAALRALLPARNSSKR